jgi:hypothetical protein
MFGDEFLYDRQPIYRFCRSRRISCEQLLPQRNASVTRAHDLKLLMDKAEKSTGGAIVNVIAYEADYVTAREQVKVIEETARIKKCSFPDNPQSNAAVR